jgi:hypothetical protein
VGEGGGGRRIGIFFLAPSRMGWEGGGRDSIVVYKGERVYSIFKW